MAMNIVTKHSILAPALRFSLPAAHPSMALLCNRQLHLHPLQVNRNSGNLILDGRSRPICHEMLTLKVSPTGKFSRLVTKCSQANELVKKKCVPCESKDLKPMSIEVAEELLQQVPGWNISNEDGKLKLERAWKVKNFIKGLEFFKHVADIAEAEGHHPDLHLVNWNNASINIWTHSIGGPALYNGVPSHKNVKKKDSDDEHVIVDYRVKVELNQSNHAIHYDQNIIDGNLIYVGKMQAIIQVDFSYFQCVIFSCKWWDTFYSSNVNE